jgi:uncharacterized protein (TIRG00374 family)
VKKKLLFVVIAAMMVFALSRLDAQGLLYSMAQVPLWLALLLFALQLATQLLVNLQWYVIAKTVGIRISFSQMFYANSAGAVMDSITPGVKFGGEVTRAMQISRVAKCTGEEAAAVVAVQKLFSVSALILVMILAAGRFAFLPFLLLFAAIFFLSRKILGALKNEPKILWLAVAFNFLRTLLGQFEILRAHKKVWLPLFGLFLFTRIFYPFKMYILILQFAPATSFFHITAITFAAYMVAMIPIFPGGLGGFEATMTALLVTANIPIESAAIVTIFFRFITFWFVMLIGAVFVLLNRGTPPCTPARGLNPLDP